ncbi:MAG TPA: phosphotransferase [Gammaproteobacteria bacterium]|nr:phosphotransferase [Gammaproteobacteria bacterium]
MIANHLCNYFKDLEDKAIFASVLGTDDVQAVESEILQLVKKQFKQDIKKVLFLIGSIGVVFGFELADGNKIVLKIFSQKITKQYLDEMHHVLQVLHAEQFPAPDALSDIFPIFDTYACFYNYISGEHPDAHRPEISRELAKYLAKFVVVVEKHDLKPMFNFVQQNSKDSFWAEPHNVLFDFAKTHAGSEWIEDKARKAREVLKQQTGTKMLAHIDWRVENSYFVDDKLVAVFDWDSLGSMSELELVGRIAAQFASNFGRSNYKSTPTPEEGRAFVAEYELYRNKKFNEQELTIISAAADDHVAYIARLEHALDMHKTGQFQLLLRELGDKSFLFARN